MAQGKPTGRAPFVAWKKDEEEGREQASKNRNLASRLSFILHQNAASILPLLKKASVATLPSAPQPAPRTLP